MKLAGAEATKNFAARFARELSPNTILALHGDLGAGKTTFMQGLVRGLGGQEDLVQSPTFTYLHRYSAEILVFHFDLYRLKQPNDFLAMGFEEMFEQGGITAIEWPERIGSLLPQKHISITLTHISEHTRQLEIQRKGAMKPCLTKSKFTEKDGSNF